MRRKRTGIFVINGKTGEKEEYGLLIAKRALDGYVLTLCEDVKRETWWILVQRAGRPIRVLGWTKETREEEARTAFMAICCDEHVEMLCEGMEVPN